MLTSTQFEQSYTTPSGSEFYTSYGVKMTKAGVETWQDDGSAQAVTSSSSTKVNPGEILVQLQLPAANGESSQSSTTRIAPASASFGGNVTVAGVLLVRPQGDISMGEYTNGPKP